MLLRVRLKKLAVYIDPDFNAFVAPRKLLFGYLGMTLVPRSFGAQARRGQEAISHTGYGNLPLSRFILHPSIRVAVL